MAISASLRQRILTALLLGPLAMAAVLWLPSSGFALFFAAVVLGAAWEWCGLAGIADTRQRILYAAAVALCMLALWLVPAIRLWVIGIAVLWWLGQAVMLWRVQRIEPRDRLDLSLLGIGLLVLAAPWAALVELHGLSPAGPALVLFLLLLTWTADTAAYFVGRRFGRVKLAPLVSPGKTREGVYGALAGACVAGALLGWSTSLGPGGTLVAALLCALTVLFSVVGDLYESLLKRRRGVKDSSRLLPGHGGLLDRIDSVTAAAPVFALGIVLIEVIA